MQQYFYEKALNDELIILGDKFHYLKNVVKVHIGEEIVLFNDGNKAIYKIDIINKRDMIVLKVKDLELNKDGLNVDLAIGLLKKDNIELVIQKATELGVNDINLLAMDNNVVKFDSKNIDKKLNRYNDIAISACEQSKRDNLSSVKYFSNIRDLDFKKYDHIFILHEKAQYEDTIFRKLKGISNDKKILLIIGPEGGISLKEIEYLESKGKVVSLGKNILRAETAAIMAVGLTINILNEEDL